MLFGQVLTYYQFSTLINEWNKIFDVFSFHICRNLFFFLFLESCFWKLGSYPLHRDKAFSGGPKKATYLLAEQNYSGHIF